MFNLEHMSAQHTHTHTLKYNEGATQLVCEYYPTRRSTNDMNETTHNNFLTHVHARTFNYFVISVMTFLFSTSSRIIHI